MHEPSCPDTPVTMIMVLLVIADTAPTLSLVLSTATPLEYH